jgi:hypothetical protein
VSKARRSGKGRQGMLELTIYGLIWLAAMLLVAFWFAYADEFSSPQEKSSFDLLNDARSKDSQGDEKEIWK